MTSIRFCQSIIFSTANANAVNSPSKKVWRRSYPLQFTILFLINEILWRIYVTKTNLTIADMPIAALKKIQLVDTFLFLMEQKVFRRADLHAVKSKIKAPLLLKIVTCIKRSKQFKIVLSITLLDKNKAGGRLELPT
jgi:hypothetical protein